MKRDLVEENGMAGIREGVQHHAGLQDERSCLAMPFFTSYAAARPFVCLPLYCTPNLCRPDLRGNTSHTKSIQRDRFGDLDK